MSNLKYIPWPKYMEIVMAERYHNEEQRFYGKLRTDMKKRLRSQRWCHKHLHLPTTI